MPVALVTPPTATIQPVAATAISTEPPSATPPSPSATATAQPPTVSSPTASRPPPTATPKPTIHLFTANVEVADPGETITLTWRWSGADSGTIYHIWPTGQLTGPHWQIGSTGSLRVTIPPERRNHDTFALYLFGADDSGVVAQQSLQIALRCPDEWFFQPAPDICAANAAVVSDGAEQPFEGGTMVWSRAEGLIYVLYDDDLQPQWHMTEDRWEEGEPASDPALEPPPGLYQPVRGFGLVWRQHPTVRERLGWALAPEQGYQIATQRTSHVRYRDIYVRALDGGVWRLRPNGSAWEHIPAADG